MIPRTAVLIVASEPVPGTSPDARRIMHRAACLARHGGGAVMAPRGSGEQLLITGVHHFPIDVPPGASPALRESAIGHALRDHLPRLRPKIIHCFGVHLAVPAIMQAWKGNKVLVEPGLTPAQRLRDETPPWPRERIADLVALEDRCIARADAVIARSATEAATLVRRGARSDRVWTIRDGVPAVERVPLPGMPHLLFAGDLGDLSGWDVLVTALTRLKRPWRATFALGQGLATGLERRVQHAKLDRRVTFARLDDIEPRLAASRIVVCPATAGRALVSGAWIPQAVLWALAAGRALIAPDLPVIRAYAGPAARYFEAGDAADLARAIDHLLAHPAEVEALAEAAKVQAKRCNWDEAEIAIRSLWDALAAS